jgi:phage gpG-like protein
MAELSLNVFGLRVKVRCSDGGGAAYLDRLAERVEHLGPVLPEIADLLRQALKKDFAAGGRPAWAPNAPSTIAKKTSAGLPRRNKNGSIPTELMQRGGFGPGTSILIASGGLLRSYTQEGAPGHVEEIDLDNNTVTVGSDLTISTKKGKLLPLALIHQYGVDGSSSGSLGRKGPTIPARQVTVQADDAEAIRAVIIRHLQGA